MNSILLCKWRSQSHQPVSVAVALTRYWGDGDADGCRGEPPPAQRPSQSPSLSAFNLSNVGGFVAAKT